MIIMIYIFLTIFLPIFLLSNLFNLERVWQHLFIPATIMTAVIVFFVFYFGFLSLNDYFMSKEQK